MQEPIKKIRMREYRTDRFSVYLDAEVDDDGNLYMSAQHIGEEASYEFEDSVLVNKDDKETVLRGLFEEQCKTVSGALAWMDTQGIPGSPGRLESLLDASSEHKDTLLLLLLN